MSVDMKRAVYRLQIFRPGQEKVGELLNDFFSDLPFASISVGDVLHVPDVFSGQIASVRVTTLVHLFSIANQSGRKAEHRIRVYTEETDFYGDAPDIDPLEELET